MTAHYFIAIPLTDTLKNFLSVWQEELKEKFSYKQWTNKQDLHITLKFLGPVENGQLKRLLQELKIIENSNAFSIKAGTIGMFGNPVKPRVLWAGVDQTDALTLLYEQVESAVLSAGLAKETRPYRPHITLAKKWDGPSDRGLVEMTQTQFKRKRMLQVEEVVVYQIFPKQTPKYKVVSSYNLGGGE